MSPRELILGPESEERTAYDCEALVRAEDLERMSIFARPAVNGTDDSEFLQLDRSVEDEASSAAVGLKAKHITTVTA